MKKIFALFALLIGLSFSGSVFAQEEKSNQIIDNLTKLYEEIAKTSYGQKPDLSTVNMTSSARSSVQSVIKDRECFLMLTFLLADIDEFDVEDYMEVKDQSLIFTLIDLLFLDVNDEDNNVVPVRVEADFDGRIIDFIIPEGETIPEPDKKKVVPNNPTLNSSQRFSDEVFETLLSMSRINDLRDYLKALKAEGTISFYGDITRVKDRKDYYMVFYTRSGEVVAIFTPGPNRRNLISRTPVSDFKKCGVELFK